eukprot:scaffold7381_cov310-Pinguiococcus_pyrenoidosus.AAC.95
MSLLEQPHLSKNSLEQGQRAQRAHAPNGFSSTTRALLKYRGFVSRNHCLRPSSRGMTSSGA